jgi:signal transduction histidine kinase
MGPLGLLRPDLRRLCLQVGLIAIPLAILLVIGIYFLRQDKLLVQSEARQQAQDLARNSTVIWSSIVTNFPPASSFTNANPWSSNEVYFAVDQSNHIIFPPPLNFFRAGENPKFSLDPGLSNLWMEAEAAEFLQHDFSRASQLWNDLSRSAVPPAVKAIAAYNLALLLEKSGRTNDADSLLIELSDAPTTYRLETGLPLAPMAALKRLSHSNPTNTLALALRLVYEPTEFSGFLLDQLPPGTPELLSVPLLWSQHQLARVLQTSFAQSTNLLLDHEGVRWCLFPSGQNIFGRTSQEVETLLRTGLSSISVPSYLTLMLYRGDHLLYSSQAEGHGELMASASTSPFSQDRVQVLLSNPNLLFARQRQRATWIASLLALSTVIALIGIVHTSRSHWKQQRLNRMKSNFVSSVTHELRAPLASMRLMSEGLQNGRIRDPEKQSEYFSYLVQECRRLSALVENVLSFSRIEQNKRVYEFEPVDLQMVIVSAINTMLPFATERTVQLLFSPDEKGHTINGDGLALQQALVNLLDNAIKHSSPGTSVQISCKSSKDKVTIEVTDTGPGIPVRERERIFDLFYRLGSELRRDTQGVGIGLSIVRHVVRAHNGTIDVDSTPGKGARFIITIHRR